MDGSSKHMSCVRCYYAAHVYDKHGMMTGVSCTANNCMFIAYDDAAQRYCGMYAERDD